MILIGLGSKAHQGKDMVASFWKEAIPELHRYSFARALKEYCRDNHDMLLPQWQLHHQTKSRPFCKDDPIYGYSAILQWYAAKAREGNANIWIEKVAAQLKADSPAI